MVNKNTVIIESNAYRKRNKYYWKNVNGTLDDLSENIDSFFSKGKRHYKRYAEAAITDIADELVQEISRYNGSDGICIEVNGAESDFICIKEVVKNKYSAKGIECQFGSRRLRPAKEVILEIKEIYRKLAEIILEYSSEGKKEFFWELMNEAGDLTLFEKCKQADDNLGEVLEAVKEKADSLSKQVDDLSGADEYNYMEDQQIKGYEESKKMAEAEKIKKAIESFNSQMQQLCENEKKRLEKEYTTFEKDLNKRFTDPKRIADWNKEVKLYKENNASGSEEKINQYIDMNINLIDKEIEKFWKGGIADLKRKIFELLQYCNHVHITEQQKQRMCRCLGEYKNLDGFCGILQQYYKKSFDLKKLTIKNANASYKEELGKVLKNGKKFITSKEHDKVFKAWSSGLSEKLYEAVEAPDTPEMPAKQETYEEKNRLFCQDEAKRVNDQLKMIQEGKKEIGKMITFEEVSVNI